MKVRLHAVECASRANGPGLRAVVWFQGCTLGCPGCFNPDTHDALRGYLADTAALAGELLTRRRQIEGVTISGGEPFQQPEALLNVLQRLDRSRLSRLVFSGYSRREIERLPLGVAVLRHVDVLIASRYVATRRVGFGLIGSANQQAHFLTNRYTATDLLRVPRREVILHSDGGVTITGICSSTFALAPTNVRRPTTL